MSTSLKRLVEILLTGVALSLAILALLPGTADAQQPGVAQPSSIDEESAVPATTQPVVVSEPAAQSTIVSPGDSLWSISQQRLSPGATPQQIALEVQQIYELNRDRIGADPNLIVAGQELLLTQPTEAATTNAPTSGLGAASGPAATGEWPKSEEAVVYEPASEPTPEPAASEPASAEQPALAEEEPATENAQPPYPEERGELVLVVSLGFFLFALAVAVFGARKLLRTRRLLTKRHEEHKDLGGTPVWVRYPHRGATLLVERALEGNTYVPSEEPPAGEAPSSIDSSPNGEGVSQQMRRLRSQAPDAPMGEVEVPRDLLGFFLAEMISQEDHTDLTADQREFLEVVATSALSPRDEIVVPRELLEAFLRGVVMT